MLTNDEDMKKIWKEYFEKLLNEEYLKEAVEDTSWNENLIDLINEKEVWEAVRLMKNYKSGSTNGSVKDTRRCKHKW